MLIFAVSIVIAILSALCVISLLCYFVDKKEQQEFRKWLENVDKELKKREVKR